MVVLDSCCRILLYKCKTSGIYVSHDCDHYYYAILECDAVRLGKNFYHNGQRQYLDNGNSFCKQRLSTVTARGR
jgi:hypothetical protein